MKKTARKKPKSKVSFGELIDSISDEIPVYQQLGANDNADDEIQEDWEAGEEPSKEVIAPAIEAEKPKEEPPKMEEDLVSHIVTKDEMADSIEKLIKIIRYIYGRAKLKVSYNADDIARATRWVDAAERLLVHISKEKLNEKEKGKGN
jgi:hypothetical protein